MHRDTQLSYTGRVKDGRIELPRKRLQAEVVSAFEGRAIEVTFRRKRKRRSNEQNAYYFGVIIEYVMRALIDLGNDLKAGNREHRLIVHEFLKAKFLDNGIDIFDAEGNVERTPPSTKRNTTVEQEEYHDRIREWALEYLKTEIPLPNEQLEAF